MDYVKALAERVSAVNDFLCATSILNWDSRTMMPLGGVASRGHQIATLKGAARETLLSDATRRACNGALETTADRDASDLDRRAAETVAAAIAHHERIPAELLAEQAALGPVAGAAWVEARANSSFASFLPYLEKTVDLARRTADAVGYGEHPYDTMVELYEPGETVASLKRLFGELRAGIAPILAVARSRPAARRDFLFRNFPKDKQRALAAELAALLGYDFARGRLDVATHPFEVSFTRNDVRITTRYFEDFLPASVFATMHEVGHGLYEQGVDANFTRSAFTTDLMGLYAVGGTSFGAHESQSRLWENHVGRGPVFWRRNFERVRAHFPDLLGDVTPDEFALAVNHVEPGFIRVEADELTYDLHIMLRVDIEMALMDGSLKPADVPEAWNAAVRRDLGVVVTDDAHGCLQDIHWSSGYIGSFPTYTIGNVMAAQVMDALRSEGPALDEALSVGDYGYLEGRLRDAIWRHGRSKTRDELLVDLTGRPLNAKPYLAYLGSKFAA